MGLYIDMEMPQSCQSCNFYNGLGCKATGRMFAIFYNVATRRSDCPLIPVPPHGLIDRERILDSIRIELAQVNAVNDMEDYDSWMRVFDYVRKFPTVIPASDEG